MGPDVTGWRVDVDLDGYTWPVRVDWGPLGGMDGGTAPAFEPGDLPGRPAGRRGELVAHRVGHWEQHHLGDPGRDAEQFTNPVGGPKMQGGPGTAQATRTQSQAEAPRGLDHRVEQARPPAAVVFTVDRHQHKGRYLMEVLGQIRRGDHGAFVVVTGPGESRSCVLQKSTADLAVQVSDPSLGLRVTDDDPPSAGLVTARGGLLG